MTMIVEKLRCDHIECNERAPHGMTKEEALDAGWLFLETAEGTWDYCSTECLEASL